MKAIKINTDIDFELVVMNKDIHYEIVHELAIPIHLLIRSRKKDLSIFKQLFNLCKTIQPDIIHCWDSMTAIYSAPICKLLKIKLVNGMVTDTIVTRKLLSKSWLRARLTFPFSDVIIGNSLAGLRTYGAKRSKSVCIYNGFNFERIDNLVAPEQLRNEILWKADEQLFIVGMVAAFEPRKDYTTLLHCAIKLCGEENNNYCFLLVGEGTMMVSLKKLVPEQLARKIIFLNRRSDVESLINIFDVAVLLTNSKLHGEGISNSILEYMALAKPVIATAGGGTNELVIDNYNGFLIPVGNEQELTHKIKTLKKNKDLIEQLGENGRKTIMEKFNIKLMTNQYISLYKSLLNS
jgi:glycosyltransferase involved in cell wall biosynthesis